MSTGRLLRAYLAEARFESLRMFRVLGFSIPFLVLPAALYLLFGVVLFGDAVRNDPVAGKFLFAAFARLRRDGAGHVWLRRHDRHGTRARTSHAQARTARASRVLPAGKIAHDHALRVHRDGHDDPRSSAAGPFAADLRAMRKRYGNQYSRFTSLLRNWTIYWNSRLRQGGHRVRKSYLCADDAHLGPVLSVAKISSRHLAGLADLSFATVGLRRARYACLRQSRNPHRCPNGFDLLLTALSSADSPG